MMTKPDQIDDDLHAAWRSAMLDLCRWYRLASDGEDVRDTWRDLVAHLDNQPVSMTALTDPELRAGIELQRKEIDRLKMHLREEGDRVAELSQDVQTTAEALAEAYSENARLMEELRGWKLRALGDEIDAALDAAKGEPTA